jgi:nicotinate-nucleotide adenylyltransferase
MTVQNKNTIGIFGGTFNPIHIGHLIIAQDALEYFNFLNILFIPCQMPPHKNKLIVAAPEHRLAMLNYALENNPFFQACDIELERGGISYSIDTVKQLEKIYPNTDLCFIIGSDTLPELYLWKDIYQLLDMCTFVTLARKNFTGELMNENNLHLKPNYVKMLKKNVITGHSIDISSSDIRHRVAEGMQIKYLVPPEVEMYIAEHNLYKNRKT